MPEEGACCQPFMQTKLSATSVISCASNSGGLPLFREDGTPTRHTVRRLSKQARGRWHRVAQARVVAVALAAVVALMLLQVTPLGMLQCAPRSYPSRDWRWLLRQLSPQLQEPGSSMAAGLHATLQQLRMAHGSSGLRSDSGSHIIVAATTDADQTHWIRERLGNVTTLRTYVVEHAAKKRKRCRELTAGNAIAAADAGCWPHLATGSGREASVYLQYIVDEWDRLPESVLFIHGHEEAWHRKSSAVFGDIVRRMRWGEVAFGSLRTWGMLSWNFWDLAIMISPTEPERCRDEERNAPEWWERCEEQGRRLEWSWERLGLNETFGLLPFEVHAPGCCAEFVVRRDRICARPRSFYSDLLDRLNQVPPEELAPAFALEHSWHAIFGEPWVTLGIGKCQLVHCSDEEMQDMHNWPPPVNHPYRYNRLPDVDRIPHA